MKMTFSGWHLLIVVAVLATSACQKKPSYPELEKSSADSLKQTRIPGVFVVGGHKAVPRPPRDASLFCPTSCATQRVYWVQVGYPVTICFPPDFSDLQVQGFSAPPHRPDSLNTLVQSKIPYTKQIRNSIIPGYRSLFCRTYGGPWIAEIKEDPQCVSCGPAKLRYMMTILGVPEQLSWSWWDSMDNHPQEVPFIGEPFVRSEASIDCDPTDLTHCGPNPGGGQGGGGDGGHPALQGDGKKK